MGGEQQIGAAVTVEVGDVVEATLGATYASEFVYNTGGDRSGARDGDGNDDGAAARDDPTPPPGGMRPRSPSGVRWPTSGRWR